MGPLLRLQPPPAAAGRARAPPPRPAARRRAPSSPPRAAALRERGKEGGRARETPPEGPRRPGLREGRGPAAAHPLRLRGRMEAGEARRASAGPPATHLLLLGRGGLGTLGRHGAAAAGRRGEGGRGRRDRRSSAQRSAATASRTRWRPLAGRGAGGTRLPPRSASPAAPPRSRRRAAPASGPAPQRHARCQACREV